MNIIDVYSSELYRIKNLCRARQLYYPFSTKNIPELIPDTFTETTIYSGFIYYCKHSTNNIKNDLLESLCGELPKDIDFTKNIDEIIEIYKRQGINYSSSEFETLLLQLSKKNIISMNLDNEIKTNTDILKKLLELDIYKEIFEDKFIEQLKALLLEKSIETSSDVKREFKNYLSREIKNLKLAINIFINKNSKLTKKDSEKINKFFDRLINFDLDLLNDVNINYWSNYLKNIINDFIKVFPNIIVNKVDTRNIKAIEHWGLSTIHNNDISYFVSGYYEKLVKFYDNTNLHKVLNYNKNILFNIKLIIDNINYNNYNYDDTKQVIFDKTITLNLLVYIFLYAIFSFTNILDNELTKYEIFGDEEVDLDSDMEKSIKILISDYLISILDINENNINIIDYNNKKIVDKITKSKEIEKTIITDGLRDLNDEEREIANIFKNNKLGEWNIGLQKGLTQYVKDNYDMERAKLEQQAINDKKMGDKGIVTEMNKEIFKLDLEYDEMIQDEIESENYNMNMIPDDDDFDPDNVGGIDDDYANF